MEYVNNNKDEFYYYFVNTLILEVNGIYIERRRSGMCAKETTLYPNHITLYLHGLTV